MEPNNGIDMEAIQEALERRKSGSMAPAMPQGGEMPMGGGAMVPVPQEQPAAPAEPAMVGAGGPPRSDESDMIVKALIDRLKQYSSPK